LSTPSEGLAPERMSERQRVPITVLAPERKNAELLRRFASDRDNVLIASDETLASAGLLGLIRVGRAMITAPDVTSRTSGCECCQVRVDLIDAVRHAVLRRSRPQRLVVVIDRATPGGGDVIDDDPASDIVTAVHTLQVDSEIERLAVLDGLVVEVDACAASTRLACGLDLWSGQREAALAIADRVVVNGSELLTESAVTAVMLALQRINRIGQVVCGHSLGAEVDGLIGLDAWHLPPSTCCERDNELAAGGGTLTDASTRHDLHCGHRAPTVGTVVLTRCGVLDPDATDAWLDRVVTESPSRILRFQAALCVSTQEPRVCVHGSRSAMRSQPEAAPEDGSTLAPQGRQESVVVLVGCDLDRQSLAESFGSIEPGR